MFTHFFVLFVLNQVCKKRFTKKVADLFGQFRFISYIYIVKGNKDIW